MKRETGACIILSESKVLKSHIPSMLQSFGYIGEKLCLSSKEEATKALNYTKDLKVLIIDGSLFDDDDLLTYIKDVYKLERAGNVIIVTFIDEKKYKLEPQITEIKPDLCKVSYLPFSRGALIAHLSKEKKKPSAFSGSVKNEKEPVKKAKNKPPPVFLEASHHVKETVDKLSILSKDRSQISSLLDIGQRFNGMLGTYSFFKANQGFSQLYHLSNIINSIYKTYEADDSLKEIKKEHMQLLTDTARVLLYMLKDLRDNKAIDEKHLATYDTVLQSYKQIEGLKTLEIKTQDEIDELLKQEEN